MELRAAIEATATAYARGLPRLAREIVERMRRELPEYGERVTQLDIWEEIRRITLESRTLQLESVGAGGALPEVCPPPDLEGARRAALAGISQAGLVLAYGIGHSSAWEAWLAAAGEVDVEDGLRFALIEELSRLTDRYDERIERLVADAHARELEASLGSANAARLRLARELIEGTTGDGAGLGYPLSGTHVAAIATGANAERALDGLARGLDGELLAIRVDEGFWWGWVARSTATGVLDRMRELEGTESSSLALGGPEAGLEGFRRTHREASSAHVVAARTGSRVTVFADIALEAVLMRDQREAEDLVMRELGPLIGSDADGHELTDTLAALFATGNARSAAASLGLHEQTVRRRLERIEERIGASISSRRVELELSLRIYRLLAEDRR